MRVIRCLAPIVALQLMSSVASAQSLLETIADSIRTGSLPPLPNDWTVTVGVEGRAAPSYFGSSSMSFDPVPVFSIHPAGRTASFRGTRDSPGITLFHAGKFSAGVVGTFDKERKESDYEPALQGLGDVNWAIEVGIFAEYWATDWFRTRVELRRGFIGQNGYIADLSSDFVAPLGNQWSVSGGPRLRLATAAALQPYFGVDATQSVASGLPIFTPKTGLESVGAGGQVKYQWNSKWASRIYVEYQRLVGDAGDSPIVTQRGSPNQVTAGVGLSYSFDFKLH